MDESLKPHNIIMIGPKGAGKTSILESYQFKDIFFNNIKPTHNMDLKTFNFHKLGIKLKIWELASGDHFIVKNYYPKAKAALIVIPITLKMFEATKYIEAYLNLLNDNAPKDIIRILVFSKIDERNNKSLNNDQLMKLWRLLDTDIPYFECSVRHNINIQEMFASIVNFIFYQNQATQQKIALKLGLFGPQSSGKTIFANRFASNEISSNLISTIGFNFFTNITKDKKIAIYDASGDPQYIDLARAYYSQVDLIAFIISIENNYFDIAKTYLETELDYLKKHHINQQIILIFTFTDVITAHKFNDSQFNEIINLIGKDTPFMRCSSNTLTKREFNKIRSDILAISKKSLLSKNINLNHTEEKKNMSQENAMHIINAILIGPQGSGKTSLLLKLNDKPLPDIVESTLGINFLNSSYAHSEQYALHIADTSGAKSFETIVNSYYHKANIFIIAININLDFEEAKEIITGIKEKIAKYTSEQGNPPKVQKLLVFTKADSPEPKLTSDQLKELQEISKVEANNCFMFSAKSTDKNIITAINDRLKSFTQSIYNVLYPSTPFHGIDFNLLTEAKAKTIIDELRSELNKVDSWFPTSPKIFSSFYGKNTKLLLNDYPDKKVNVPDDICRIIDSINIFMKFSKTSISYLDVLQNIIVIASNFYTFHNTSGSSSPARNFYQNTLPNVIKRNLNATQYTALKNNN